MRHLGEIKGNGFFWLVLVITAFLFLSPSLAYSLTTTISGEVTCSAFTSGDIIAVAAFTRGWESTTPIALQYLDFPSFYTYTFEDIPVGEIIYIIAVCDKDNNGRVSIDDYIGEYVGNPILTENGGYVNVNINISHVVNDAETQNFYLVYGDYKLGKGERNAAYESYQQAKIQEPDNPNANLMLAATTLTYHLEDNIDPELHTLLDGFDEDFPKVITGDEPTVTECQDTVTDHIIPYIDEAISLLNIAQSDPLFIRGVPAEMQAGILGKEEIEDYQDKEWDYADSLTFEGGLHLAKGLLLMLTSYELDVDYAVVSADNFIFQDYLDAHPALLTLRAEGNTRMANAGVEVKTALDLLLGAYDVIELETDDQSNDFVTLADLESGDKTKIHDLLSQLRDSFDGTVTIVPNNYNDEYIPEGPVNLNLYNFFNYPIDRTDLPEFDDENKIILGTFPDPTLNGTLPGMTQERITGWVREGVDWENCYVVSDDTFHLSWEETPYPGEFVSYQIYRSNTLQEIDNPANLIATITDSSTVTYEDSGLSEDRYYYCLFANYTDGSSTWSIQQSVFRVFVAVGDGSEGTRTDPFGSIGDALDFIDHHEGGTGGVTIYVAEGTYNESIYFNRDITLKGGYESEGWTRDISNNVTIINGNDNNALGLQDGDDYIVSGFTISGGYYNVVNIDNASGTIKNCLIIGTGEYEWSDGIECLNGANATIENCTIVNNSSGIDVWGYSSATIKNTIITDNSAGIHKSSDSTVYISYSDVWGNDGGGNYFGMDGQTGINGNISADPLFVDPASNYHLQPGSPCIGTGEGGVDMGAYGGLEDFYTISGQVTLNGGTADTTDILLTLSGALTDSVHPSPDGSYSFTELEEGLYVVTPSWEDYHFFPASRSYPYLISDQTEQDFTALHKDYDSDEDGLPDWWEWTHFGVGNLEQGPNDDYDGDDYTNLDEYTHDTDPNDAGSKPLPTIWYVDGDATAGGNGRDWTTAFKYLQDALTNPSLISGDEIRVAQGIYKPDRDNNNPNGTGNYNATFQLINGVTIKGGYAGIGALDPTAYNIEAYETILSGDIDGDGTLYNNSYTVMTGSSVGTLETIIDGFTITGGNNIDPSIKASGGGMANDSSSSLTIRNCIFKENYCWRSGGGISNRSCSPMKIINCFFVNNSAAWGAGIYNNNTYVEVINCVFSGNSTTHGGGMGIYNCSPKLVNCTFNRNSASRHGGGIYNSNSNPIITNCIFWENGEEISGNNISNPTVTYCNIEGGYPGEGNIDTDPLFVDAENVDYHLQKNSLCIDAGDPDYVAESGETDLDGRSRVINGRIDMGAYEYEAQFIDSGINFPGVYYGTVTWGDYDNDGDLDLAVCGDTGSGAITKIYRNDDGAFTALSAGLVGVMDGSLAWCDYDNDGRLDISVAGYTGSNYITKIYRNDDNDTFTDVSTSLPKGCTFLTWGDYDNDGDVDLAVSGYYSLFDYSSLGNRIYRNEGNGAFTGIKVGGSSGMFIGPLAWGDYDNDGDLDLALCGLDIHIQGPTNLISKIYRNNGNDTFADIGAGLTNVYSGSLAWGDYDNDGDLDIALCGRSSSGVITKIYRNDRNDGDNTFTDIDTGLAGACAGSVAWGDYDNDGNLDLAVCGNNGSNQPITRIYKNEGGDIFTDIGAAGLPGGSSLAWGDCDNDGDLDLAVCGETELGEKITRIYRNNTGSNTIPSAPTGLTYEEEGESNTILKWNSGSDTETPDSGLYYNLRVGTISGADDIVSGVYGSPLLGNYLRPKLAPNELGVRLKGLLAGAYYFSVQTIDTGLMKSEWSMEETFFLPIP